MKIVGLDLSLTSIGVAIIVNGHAVTDRIMSKGTRAATLAQRERRLRSLTEKIGTFTTGADLVVIEGPSYGQARQGGQHDRAGLWWLVVSHTLGDHIDAADVVEVPPAARAKYATGKGNAPKDQVLAAVVRRYPDVDVTGNDEADALILAAMGARQLGAPIDDMPQLHLEAMVKVTWPETAGVT